jgi:hypothetical protein
VETQAPNVRNRGKKIAITRFFQNLDFVKKPPESGECKGKKEFFTIVSTVNSK